MEKLKIFGSLKFYQTGIKFVSPKQLIKKRIRKGGEIRVTRVMANVFERENQINPNEPNLTELSHYKELIIDSLAKNELSPAGFFLL